MEAGVCRPLRSLRQAITLATRGRHSQRGDCKADSSKQVGQGARLQLSSLPKLLLSCLAFDL